jgi:hypothetical protein
LHIIKSSLDQGVVVHTVIPALRSLRQEDIEFETSLGYIARPCLKIKEEKLI